MIRLTRSDLAQTARTRRRALDLQPKRGRRAARVKVGPLGQNHLLLVAHVRPAPQPTQKRGKARGTDRSMSGRLDVISPRDEGGHVIVQGFQRRFVRVYHVAGRIVVVFNVAPQLLG